MDQITQLICFTNLSSHGNQLNGRTTTQACPANNKTLANIVTAERSKHLLGYLRKTNPSSWDQFYVVCYSTSAASHKFISILSLNASFQLGMQGWKLMFDEQESLCLLENSLVWYGPAPTRHLHLSFLLHLLLKWSNLSLLRKHFMGT